MKKAIFVLFLLMITAFCYAETNIFIKTSSTSPASLQGGDTDASILIEASSRATFSYKNITFETDFKSPFEPVRSSFFLNELNPNEKTTVSFKFNIGNADPGTYTLPVTIKATGVTTEGQTYLTEVIRYITFEVSSKPNLEITSIEIIPTNPLVKSTFQAKFKVKNVGEAIATDISAKISIDSAAFIQWIPDTKVVRNLSPGEEAELSYIGVTNLHTEPNAYVGKISLTYSGKTLENNFVVDLYGAPDLQVSTVSTDEDIQPGKKITLSVQFENIGTGDARSARATITGADIDGILDSHIGTVKVDDTGTAIFDITVKNDGKIAIPLTLTYEDALGKQYDVRSTLELFAYKQQQDGIIFVVPAIFITAAAYFILRRRDKAKKLKHVRNM